MRLKGIKYLGQFLTQPERVRAKTPKPTVLLYKTVPVLYFSLYLRWFCLYRDIVTDHLG